MKRPSAVLSTVKESGNYRLGDKAVVPYLRMERLPYFLGLLAFAGIQRICEHSPVTLSATSAVHLR